MELNKQVYTIKLKIEADPEDIAEFLRQEYPDCIDEMPTEDAMIVKSYVDGVVSSNLDCDAMGRLVESEVV